MCILGDIMHVVVVLISVISEIRTVKLSLVVAF